MVLLLKYLTIKSKNQDISTTLPRVYWVSKYSAKTGKPKKFYQNQSFFMVSGGYLKFIQYWLNICKVPFLIFWYHRHPCGFTSKPWIKSAQELLVCLLILYKLYYESVQTSFLEWSWKMSVGCCADNFLKKTKTAICKH